MVEHDEFVRDAMQNDNVVQNDVNVHEALADERLQLLRDVAGALRAYPGGGPNLRDKHLAEAKRLGLDAGQIADQWDHVIRQGRGPYANLGIRPLSGPSGLPRPASTKPANDPRPPKTEVASNVSRDAAATAKAALAGIKAKREPEPEPEPEKAELKVGLPAVIPITKPLSDERVSRWDDAMAAMNEQHVIENVGNKTVIASWEPSPTNLNRRVLVFQGKDSFLLRYSNRSVQIEISNGVGGYKLLRLPIGTWWLSHRDRRQHRGVTFRPGALEVVSECLNMWQGWGVVPKAGDWGLIREHIEEVIAGGNKEFADYVIRWIAWAIQNPAAQAEVALVLIGLKGAGKGTLVRVLQRIFGAHAFQVTSREEVIGKFNGHLQDCVLFVADEAYWGGDKRCVGRLQGMITEPTLPIERKGFDLILVPNYLHVLMLAEPGWVIPAGKHERRYAAFAVSDARMRDREYFNAPSSPDRQWWCRSNDVGLTADGLGGLASEGNAGRPVEECCVTTTTNSDAVATRTMVSIPVARWSRPRSVGQQQSQEQEDVEAQHRLYQKPARRCNRTFSPTSLGVERQHHSGFHDRRKLAQGHEVSRQ
jgi:hypothetical protein